MRTEPEQIISLLKASAVADGHVREVDEALTVTYHLRAVFITTQNRFLPMTCS